MLEYLTYESLGSLARYERQAVARYTQVSDPALVLPVIAAQKLPNMLQSRHLYLREGRLQLTGVNGYLQAIQPYPYQVLFTYLVASWHHCYAVDSEGQLYEGMSTTSLHPPLPQPVRLASN
jgi:hypothetical protein